MHSEAAQKEAEKETARNMKSTAPFVLIVSCLIASLSAAGEGNTDDVAPPPAPGDFAFTLSNGYVESREGYIGSWILGSDYNRNAYTLNTSIAFGLKAVIWFIGGPFDTDGNIDPKHRFFHLVKIGREMRALWPEIGKIGRPAAVYSTPTEKTASDKDKEQGLPWNLPPFPENHWLRVAKGAAVLGFFTYGGKGDDALYVANHNARAPQEMVLKLDARTCGTATVELFDRETGTWRRLRKTGDAVSFPLRPAGGELLRVGGRTRP